MAIQPTIQPVRWEKSACLLVDQTRLPSEESYLTCTKVSDLVTAIQSLAVRGAPALGVAGAYGAVLAAQEALAGGRSASWRSFEVLCEKVASSRPTAVNLRWGVDRVKSVVPVAEISQDSILKLLEEARKIHAEDSKWNEQMARHGAKLFSKGAAMTICNTGDLCTGGFGTAFGVLREAFFQERIDQVYALETRPVLQGLRLTAWELERNQIDYTMICDSMAASVMRDRSISGVIVGADRIVANGDFANKIGTYMLAVLAKHHQIPFFVAAPSSTFDFKVKHGAEIPIEERPAEEILSVLGSNRPQKPFRVYNPSFDVTPHELVTGIVCEQGVIERPDAERIRRFFSEGKA